MITNKGSCCQGKDSYTERDELQDVEHLKRIAPPPYSQYGLGYWANFWAGDTWDECKWRHRGDF